MKYFMMFLMGCIVSCTNNKSETPPEIITTIPAKETTRMITPPIEPIKKMYSNKRFREVSVEKLGTDSFRIKGRAQVFEASLSWVLEDGHNELKQGYTTTDAGAPEWGKFKFDVQIPKKRPGSSIHIILFEASAKDGSRQHELPVFLINSN